MITCIKEHMTGHLGWALVYNKEGLGPLLQRFT
jgi:hypothetical protein